MSDSVRDKLIKNSNDLVASFNKHSDAYMYGGEHGFRMFVCRCLVAILCLLLIQAGEKGD